MIIGILYEYSHHFDKDEEVYKNSSNMTVLSKCFKNKGSTIGGKDSSSATKKQLQKQKEEALKKQQEEAEKKHQEEAERK